MPEGYSDAELLEFREKTGVSHFLVRRFGPVEMEHEFDNGNYRVYDLTRLKAPLKDDKE